MARSKQNGMDTRAGTAASATADAAAGALRAAAEADQDAGRRLETSHLTELCGLAADHLAMAHKALFEGPQEDAEEAISHLDAALTCLKQLDTETARTARSPMVRRRA